MGIPVMKAGFSVDCAKSGGRRIAVRLMYLYATIVRPDTGLYSYLPDMKEDSDVVLCSPGESSDSSDSETEFKVQGKHRWRSKSDLSDNNVAKKKPNYVTNALPSAVNNSLSHTPIRS
ncbi:hypothetical protein AVEN_54598-1 [Araneus ventricosus]|uniref:Uncharacterized protein n=1 Tax=Araneus ventricosus TaxID=182803 RepID=A0A4Y2BNU8_ARAVE|nr:hypothetical protein AVEN_54598-1 [Araneus ventricosus]